MGADQIAREPELIAAEVARASQQAPLSGVYRAIVKVSADMAREGVPKDQRNQQQGYAFRGIDSVMNALAPLLAKHGLVILPRMLSRSASERATQKGGTLFHVAVEMEFDFVSAADGSKHTVRMFGEAMDSADKSTNKAASAAYKYAAFQTFCIPTEGDNDADATTPEPVIQLQEAPAPPRERQNPAAATVEARGTSNHDGGYPPIPKPLPPPPAAPMPHGFALIDEVKMDGDFIQVFWGRDAQGGWTKYKTKLPHVGADARDAFRDKMPVRIHSKKDGWLDKVERLDKVAVA